MIYELSSNLNISDFTLENCLFGAVKLTKNADIDKYEYSGYGIDLMYVELFHFVMVDLVRM